MGGGTGAGSGGVTRRQLLRMIGLSAGSAVMYQAMTSLGFAAESGFTGFPKLGAAPRGELTRVLVADDDLTDTTDNTRMHLVQVAGPDTLTAADVTGGTLEVFRSVTFTGSSP